MQSRLMSFIEACVNTLIGLCIAYFASIAICRAYGIPITPRSNFILTGWMTVISVLRGFFLRRFFNNVKRWWRQWTCAHRYSFVDTCDGELVAECRDCGHQVRDRYQAAD